MRLYRTSTRTPIPNKAAYSGYPLQGIVIFCLVKGRVDEVRFVWDKFALMQQIGALPK